jgi:Ca2+-binding EF-hand superfamily protein
MFHSFFLGHDLATTTLLKCNLKPKPQITDAFLIFDTQENKQVDVREVGTVVRSLGCCPTESEVNELIAETEDETASGYVRLDRLLPVLTKVLLDKKYR